jgi:type I restriction enzyme M protein
MNPASITQAIENKGNAYLSVCPQQPLRLLAEIRADLLAVEKEAEGLLEEIIGGSLETKGLEKLIWRSGK